MTADPDLAATLVTSELLLLLLLMLLLLKCPLHCSQMVSFDLPYPSLSHKEHYDGHVTCVYSDAVLDLSPR